jgi:putative restriction endonuclease
MSKRSPNWIREELILAFNLYIKIPYGTITGSNPQVIELAQLIGRTPNAVGLKLCNFAPFDPYHKARGVKGLANGGKLDGIIFREFTNNWDDLLFESEQIRMKYQHSTIEENYADIIANISQKKGEVKIREVKTRVNQNLFRRMILSIYGGKCAVSALDNPEFLIASHIKRWADDPNERLNPENGICLSALYDRAFEEGFIAINANYQILIASELKKKKDKPFYNDFFGKYDGQLLHLPDRFLPNEQFIKEHLENRFRG